MSIQRQSIDEAAQAVQTAQESLQAAQEAHTAAILTEANRLVQERVSKDVERDEARRRLETIHAEKQNLEADEERYFALYQRADFRGDEPSAENARAAGDVAREQLVKIRADEEQARRNLEALDFDEDVADDLLTHDVSALRRLVPDDAREEAEAGITAAFNPISRAMRERDEERNQREHRRRAEASQRRNDAHRRPSGVVHIPNSQGR